MKWCGIELTYCKEHRCYACRICTPEEYEKAFGSQEEEDDR